MVVNRKGNTVTSVPLTPSVKEVRLRATESSEVELVVKNQQPLRVGRWVSTDKPVDLDVGFKDGPRHRPGGGRGGSSDGPVELVGAPQ